MKNIEKFIENNAPMDNVRSALVSVFSKEHYREWLVSMLNEYETLYPPTRDMTYDEYDGELSEDEYNALEDKPQVEIEYDITFDAWLNEERVISDAVYDEDGNLITPEVTEKVRPYVPKDDWTVEIDEYLNNSEAYKKRLKYEQDIVIDNLTVEVNGKVFDANIVARQNMTDAILASETANLTETVWRLADNTQVVVTVDELKQAQLLALQVYANAKGI